MKTIQFVKAGYSALAIKTTEERRTMESLRAEAKEHGYTFATWDTGGTFYTFTPYSDTADRADADGPMEALGAIASLPERAIIAIPDFDVLFTEDSKRTANPQLLRGLKTTLALMETEQKTLVIIGPRCTFPPELAPLVRIINQDLPTVEELQSAAMTLATSANLDTSRTEGAAKAAAGLTLTEATNAFALSAVMHKELRPEVIWSTKCEIIASQSPLEIVKTRVPQSDIGGLDNLLQWIERRKRAFSPEAKAFNLPVPKGILLLGPAGTGKSHTAKAVATIMDCPLVKLDMGRVYGSLVGESEANIRRCIEVAEAIAPCVLWIDELEKSASGAKSSAATDGGTGSRVLATLLTWLNDKTSSVFVVATANDVSALPPELMRKGRFDEQWFVDLPCKEEREKILEIHIRKREHAIPEHLCRAADAARGFVGAELEAVVVEALFQAFDDREPLALHHILSAINATKPMSCMMKESISELRKWSEGRARPASSKSKEGTAEQVRKLSVTDGN